MNGTSRTLLGLHARPVGAEAILGHRTTRKPPPFRRVVALGAIAIAALAVRPAPALAHCDTLDGPVVAAARVALQSRTIVPVLKWVKPDAEPELRAAFERTLAVRTRGADAKALADMYFFETLVRLHRAGEGAPYTGLKPAGGVPPVLEAADKALEEGSIDALIGRVTGELAAGMRERFARAAGAKRHAAESVEAGRAFVESYVDYVHYIERLHDLTAAAEPAHGGSGHASGSQDTGAARGK